MSVKPSSKRGGVKRQFGYLIFIFFFTSFLNWHQKSNAIFDSAEPTRAPFIQPTSTEESQSIPEAVPTIADVTEPVDIPTPTAVVLETTATVEPTIQLEATIQATETAVPTCDGSGIDWNQQLADFSGSQWDVYQQFVLPVKPEMCWEAFTRLVFEYNPHLQDDDGVFYDDKTYILPGGN